MSIYVAFISWYYYTKESKTDQKGKAMNDNTNTIHEATDFDILDQYDDFGDLYGAFTIKKDSWEAFDDFSHDVQMPDLSTWYENVITGWASGTPHYYDTEVYTIEGLPTDFDAWDYEELTDEEREEIAFRAHVCLDNPHDDDNAKRAGLVHLGSFRTDTRNSAEPDQVAFLRSLTEFLDSIDYEDVTSF